MVQDNAQVLQQEFLASLLTEAKQADEKKKVAKLKAIQQAEYMNKLWPKLRKYVKRLEVRISEKTLETLAGHRACCQFFT